MNLKARSTSLQSRITRYLVGFSLLFSLLFSGVNFISLYTIEDDFFNSLLKAEASHLSQVFEQTGEWPRPRFSYMQLYQSVEDFPEAIYRVIAEEPERIELSGENDQYFHIHRFNRQQGPFLIAEVSEQLLVRASRESLFWLLGTWSVLMTIAAAILGLTLARSATRPLTQLADFVVNLSPDKLPRQFSNRYPNNEVGQLAAALEQLMARIKTLIDREQQFTRDASHELRTPIAVIRSSAELLLQNKTSLEKNQRQLSSQIVAACDQMEQTVSTLLSLARENEQPSASSITVLPLVEKVVVQQARHLEDKPVEVHLEIAAEERLWVAKNDLLILLSNLIGNAFQYTNEGHVTIGVKANCLSVTDTGEGIEQQIQASATDALVKGSNSKGFGIGLSLVARLCERHKIDLKIEHLKDGTRVNLLFPQP